MLYQSAAVTQFSLMSISNWWVESTRQLYPMILVIPLPIRLVEWSPTFLQLCLRTAAISFIHRYSFLVHIHTSSSWDCTNRCIECRTRMHSSVSSERNLTGSSKLSVSSLIVLRPKESDDDHGYFAMYASYDTPAGVGWLGISPVTVPVWMRKDLSVLIYSQVITPLLHNNLKQFDTVRYLVDL